MLSMIYVEHIKNRHNFDSYEYVGRKCYGFPESILSNPFKITKTCTRKQVIDKYREYFYQKLKDRDLAVLVEVLKLYKLSMKGDLYLLCWCYPKKCHANVIREYLLEWQKYDLIF